MTGRGIRGLMMGEMTTAKTKLDTKIEKIIKEKVAEEVKKYFQKPFYGLWKGLSITNKDIEEAKSWLGQKADDF